MSSYHVTKALASFPDFKQAQRKWIISTNDKHKKMFDDRNRRVGTKTFLREKWIITKFTIAKGWVQRDRFTDDIKALKLLKDSRERRGMGSSSSRNKIEKQPRFTELCEREKLKGRKYIICSLLCCWALCFGN